MPEDIRFVVTDKAHQYKGTIIAKSSEITLGWNVASVANFRVDDDHRMLEHLATEGARVRVLVDGVQEMAGPVENLKGTFPNGDVAATVRDDFLQLSYVLAWAKPTAAITAQDQEYRSYSGVSETVAKTAIGEASTRLGLGWVVAASGGKGTSTRVDTRFHSLSDKLLESLIRDRLRLTLVRDPAGVVTVDVTAGAVIPRTLTLESGLLDGGEWSLQVPTATRVIVGGAGEGVARQLAEYVDTAREALYGFKREVFRDARMSDEGADLSEDAAGTFEEGAAKASISCDLAESSWFRYRAGYHVGDVVSVQVGPVSTSEVIRQVVIRESEREGVTVVPSIGETSDSPDQQLAQAVGRLARNVRDQGRR